MSSKILLVLTWYVRPVVEPANQELASTATPEPIHNNTDIIETDESTMMLVVEDSSISMMSVLLWMGSGVAVKAYP